MKSLSFLLALLLAFVLTLKVCAQIQAQSLDDSDKLYFVSLQKNSYEQKIPSSPPKTSSSVTKPAKTSSSVTTSPKCQYNEEDTDIVIATIKKYVGIVPSRFILNKLKKRLPEAEVNNLNIDRIMDYLLEAFKNDEDALYKISKFREKNTS